ncbi:MAG: PilC/PilY family type IV pilus protein [Telluria sp.]
MKRLFTLFTLVMLAGAAGAATTSIAQLPLLNINGTGSVKPNLMLLYDNSGSMAWNFTPDYIDDTKSCRSRATLAGGTKGCAVGDAPFNSADFNRQYYDPRVTYAPPVKSDGSSYASMTSANTTAWTKVSTDGFNVNTRDLRNNSATLTNLVTGFPDQKWCDGNGNCRTNTSTYSYPDDTFYSSSNISGNPYYYTIKVAEYCTDSTMTNCKVTNVGAPAPAGYPVAAKVRWCTDRALTNCQAKYVGSYVYPRFSDPNRSPDWYGTVTINSSVSTKPMSISSVSVVTPSGTYAITNGAVSAATGTDTTSKQATVANNLALSIIARTGTAETYTACVSTPGATGIPACSSFGITLSGTNVVAVVPISCPAGATSKAVGPCTLLNDGSRAGRDLAVSAGTGATALLTVTNSSNSNKTQVIGSLTLGSTKLLSKLSLGQGKSSSQVAQAIATAVGTVGGITAYVGGTAGTPAVCANATTSQVCLVDSDPTNDGESLSVTQPTNGTRSNPLTLSTADAISDGVPTTTTELGGSVFVRTDIVSSRTSYPKDPGRVDCAGTTCTYDEEMTNFANWYAYYKTRNQMMKTAVGQAFRPLTDSYKVGIVSLSDAAAEAAMTPPLAFSGTNRDNWYAKLYQMDGSNSTPLRPALHAIGKMYANLSPYVATAGSEVVQLPCQQNFTFITTDGYWNGNAAATVTNNDNVESATRFCLRSKGCVDPATQSYNSLADVALYWYNGGSNNSTTSLRPTLENMNKPGLVPAAAGENTHLHMNTYALGLGVDGVMNYEPNYDTAPLVGGDFYRVITAASTGCPWNNNGAYNWPDPATGDSNGGAAYQSRVDDLWHAAVNGHGKYFAASNPRQVVNGLSSALANIEVKVGAAAAAATSTPNISQQDNDVFSSTFTTVKWFGELSDRKIDTVTGNVSGSPIWNSSDMVGRKVAASSDTRTIMMADTVGGGLKTFDYSQMTALERGWFDNKCSAMAQCAMLSTSDRAIVNSGANLVNYLRGQQQYANDTVMRAYTRTDHNPSGLTAPLPIVLGDIASSKPAYMRDPRKGYTLAGYNDFKVANASRRATVFVAANDGMLHAFDAATGDELWAYVPRITMAKMYSLASTNYGSNHQFTVDGSPEVSDVQIGGVWKTVLVAGLNAGGRGYYALDVTDPDNPAMLWEFCADSTVCAANNNTDLGLSFGNPQFGTWRDSGGTHWVVFLTSGYNNVPGSDGVAGGTGKGFLFVVDVATGSVLAKVGTGSGSTATPSGLAKITAITANPITDPLVTYVYGGDVLGKLWRFDFTSPGAGSVIQMGDAGSLQPITTRPDVTMCQVGTTTQRVVAYGTGRLLDLPDVHNTDLQSAYVLKDDGSPVTSAEWRQGASMLKRTLTPVAGTSNYTTSATAVDLTAATTRGWYLDFDQNAGERVNLDPKIVSGGLNIVTNIPSSSSDCSLGGTSNVYQLNVCTAQPLLDTNAAVAGTTLSNTSAAVGFIIVRLPSGAMKMITTTADGSTITSGVAPATSQGAHKSGWRRVHE